MANEEFYQRRLRIDHVNRRVKRCHSVKDHSRLWKVASLIGGGASAGPSIMPGSSSRLAVDNLIGINSNTLLVEQTLEQHQLLPQLTAADRRAFTPVFYEHVNPYGVFALHLDQPPLLEVA